MKIHDSSHHGQVSPKSPLDVSASSEKGPNKTSPAASVRTPSSSPVELSENAQSLRRGVEAAKQASVSPERAEKIASLKRQIADKTYKVDADVLADRILNEHLSNHFGKNGL